MLTFNMDSLPIVRQSFRPGQSLTFNGTSYSPEGLLEVDSFECTYEWIPIGHSTVKQAYDRVLTWAGFIPYRDKADGQDTLENPNFVGSAGGLSTKPER